MPELPEMEHYRQLLDSRLTSRVITETEVSRDKSINVSPERFHHAVTGQAVRLVGRMGKYLLFYLTSGQVLVLHLMLGGILFYGRREEQPKRTVQVRLGFGTEHLFCIGLRLGYLHLHEERELAGLFTKLGPDPLDPALTETRFADMLAARRGTLKSSLIDQSFVSGIGGCYSDEICFSAGLLPARKPGALMPAERQALYAAMRSVLAEAEQYGGYMDMPLYAGDRITGGFDSRCRVYDREGEPCLRCGSPIVRADISSKKSFCCTVCQR